MSEEVNTETALVGCLMYLVIAVTIGALCLDYTVEFWAAYFGRPVELPFYVSAIAAIFLSKLAIPLAVVTWILSFVL